MEISLSASRSRGDLAELIGDVSLVMLDLSNYAMIRDALLLHGVRFAEWTTVFVSLNLPAGRVRRNLGEAGGSEKFFVVDCVSRISSAGGILEAPGSFQVSSPASLTDLSDALEQIFREFRKPLLVVVDTINSLLPYNEFEKTVQFLHLLLVKARRYEVNAVFLALDGLDPRLASLVGVMCDKVAKVTL